MKIGIITQKRGVEIDVGFPDKHLPMPPDIHHIPPNTKVLGAYWTSDLNTLKPLFLLLLSLIFPASKA
jgi:hypothetical protein